MSSSSTNGLAKAKAQNKTSVNIAALAARNLGGFVPNKIFVGGVPIQSTEEQFKAYFERFGGISKVELHALRGFGYITYESVESVDQCLEKYEEHYLCKKWVEVKRSIPRELIDSYEREQKRLEAEFKASNDSGDHSITLDHGEAPSVKVETPNNAGSSPPIWGMPPPGRSPVLPEPGVRSRTAKAAPAGPPPSEEPGGSAMSSQISQLTEMGFSEEVARRVFRECAWDFNKALDRLLTSMGTEDALGGPPDAAEDPPLSAAFAPTAAESSPMAAVVASPQARAKDAPAWGKPAQSAWAKPAESVWGMPKTAGSAWGKASPPPSAKAPPGTPKANTKAVSGSPKAVGIEPAGLPALPTAAVPPPPSSTGAGQKGGYNLAVAQAKAEAPPQAEGDPITQPPIGSSGVSPPATPPPSKPTASHPPPPANLPPAATSANPLAGKIQQEELEPSISQSENARLPPNQQPPENIAPTGEDSAEPMLPSTSGEIGATDGAEEVAVAAAANLLDSDEPSQDTTAEPPAPIVPDMKAGHLDPAHAAEGAPVGTPPRKRVQRMKREWIAEDPSQLSASEGDFVSVWIDTGTEHGWIHTENLTGALAGSVGWLPVCVLNTLPDNRRWMRTKQAWQAMGDSQCNVEDNTWAVVWIDSRTAQGWTYIEASEDTNTQPGWLPDFCLEWNDD